MAFIDIKNMEFYAFHGCFSEERNIGTHFRVSLHMQVDTEIAQKSDSIDDTVNYLSVYQTVKRQMMVPSRLLENVADRIATSVLSEFPSVEFVSVKVSKLNPPLGGKMESVSLTIEKFRVILS